MSQSPTLTVTLGLNGTLRLLYPNGKSIDLPAGDAEARMVEILQGFRKTLPQVRSDINSRAIHQALDAALAAPTIRPDNPHGLPQARRFGPLLRPNREITLEELGLDE